MNEYVLMNSNIALGSILKPNEHIACRNATIIVDENGEFSGWIDNDGVIMMIGGDNDG